jgi:TonB family protein
MRRRSVLLTAACLIAADAASAQKTSAKGYADYPTEALAKHEQGAVLVELTVGPDGKVSKCSVLVSNGSQALDQQTCTMFETEARFTPARGPHGAAIESSVRGMVTWVIPGCPAPPQPDRRLREHVDASAKITSLEHCRH